MKKLYILITFLFLTTNFVNAQIDVVNSGIVSPSRIFLEGNLLYIADYDGSKISVINITDTPLPLAPASVVNTGIMAGQPWGLQVSGTDLYIADYDAGIIYKKNLIDNPTLPLVEVVTGLTNPGDFALELNYLYIADYGTGEISRIDVTNTGYPLTPEVVVTNIVGVGGIVFNGNDLYMSNYDNADIIKVDISTFTGPGTELDASVDGVIIADTGLNQPDGLIMDGDILYIANSGLSSISKIDVSTYVATPLVPQDIISGLDSPTDIALSGTDLYIAELNGYGPFGTGTTISMVDLSTLSVKKYNSLGLTMYPNPSSDFIKFSGLKTTESYEISNMLGAKVQTGKVSQNENINVSSLNKGMYFVKLENGTSLKFIKN